MGVHPMTMSDDDTNRTSGRNESYVTNINDADKEGGDPGTDRAVAQFSTGSSMRTQTNHLGTQGKKFHLEPSLGAVSSTFSYSEKLTKAKLPVQDFWVYDGAHPGLTDRGSVATSRDQILPNKRIREQDAIEWNRVGSKKGWMFNGKPQEDLGGTGENSPTHTSDGYISRISDTKWSPLARSVDRQYLALHEQPAIDIENNARGIGVTGGGSGNGGMAGGYREVTPSRLKTLPVPMSKFNWTGTRLHGTGREDQYLSSGAGGFRAGYRSQYGIRPSFQQRRTTGLSRVTQSAA